MNAAVKESGYFVIALFYYGATSFFPLSAVVEQSFNDFNLFYKLFYCVASITHIELKYVTAWNLGMVSMRASGITYNPSKNTKYDDGTVNHDFSRIEVNNMTKFYL